MGVDQYKGLLFLFSGFSFFVIMLFLLRLFSRNSETNQTEKSLSGWVGPEELEVVDVIVETYNVKSFKLRRLSRKSFPNFKGGQFLSFQIGNDPGVTRSYSISSLEQNRDVVQISVKLISDGVGSSWFHKLQCGDKVIAFSPHGHFVDSGVGSQDRVFIAGGIGITPTLSIILSNLEKAHSFKMTLFYGVRSHADLAFHGLLKFLAGRHPQFKYFLILSHDSSWQGDKGYLTLDFINEKLKITQDQIFYICGPDVMADPILEALDRIAVPEENIFNEKFISSATFNESSLPERRVQVKWLGEVLQYHGRSSVLSFLESKGQSLPYACRTGVCGSCKCRIKGEFKTLTKAGLTRKEQKEGLALACVSYPEGDIEIELFQPS